MSDKAEKPEVVWKQLVKKDTTQFVIYGVQCDVNNQRYSVGVTKDFYGVRRGEIPVSGLKALPISSCIPEKATDLILRIDYLEQIMDFKESKLACEALTELILTEFAVTKGFSQMTDGHIWSKTAGLAWSVVNIFDVLQDSDLSEPGVREALKELKKTPFFKHLVISSLEGN